MSCPLLRRTHPPQCRAVSGGSGPLAREVVATYCHGPFGECPAYRFVRASGRLLHPADFRAWVVQGIPPGRLAPDGEIGPDGP